MKCIFMMHILAPVGQYIISAEMSGLYKEKDYCVLRMILVKFPGMCLERNADIKSTGEYRIEANILMQSCPIQCSLVF